MQKLIKSPLFYVNIVLLIAFFSLVTSINVNQTNLPSFLKKAIAAVQAITGEGGVGYLSAFTATNQIGNSIIYDTGTNIGIGTTAPTSILDVRKDGVAPIQWGSSAKAVGFLGHNGNDALVGAIGSVGGSLRLRAGNQDRMFISSNGNVGIGTNAPGQKLTIVNGGNIEVLDGVISVKGAYTAGSLNLSGRDIQTSAEQDLYLNWNNNSKNVIIGGEGEQKALYMAGTNSYVDANDYWIRSAGKWASQLGGGGGGFQNVIGSFSFSITNATECNGGACNGDKYTADKLCRDRGYICSSGYTTSYCNPYHNINGWVGNGWQDTGIDCSGGSTNNITTLYCAK